MIFYDVQQGSKEWHELRMGIPTASGFDKIMTPAKGEFSKSADKFIAKLIGEKMAGYLPERAEHFTSRAVEWGKMTEDEARRFYAMEKDCTVTNGGFCTTDDGRLGASPDGLVGDDGILELKCPLEETHVGYLLDGGLPDDYKLQVHGQLLVTGRAWCDFMSYALKLPPFLVRVVPDEFTLKLADIIYGKFLPRYDALLAKVRGGS